MSERQAGTASLDLVGLVREDYRARGGGPLSPGFHAVAVYRFGRWAASRPHPQRALLSLIHRLLFVLVRNLYGIEIPVEADLGRRLSIAHQGGIVLNPRTVMGDDCLLRHNTTIGAGGAGGSAPTIGNRVDIGAGAVVMGDISIGDDVRIGPNAVVMNDVPAGGSAFAAPARIIRQPVRQATANSDTAAGRQARRQDSTS
jgi:serine O-acetyltransferase